MTERKPICIVGGGLAGLSLGIALRQRLVPVTVVEAHGYPRHRVCGEFISGRGQETLSRLGLLQPLIAAGARWARNAACYAPAASLVRWDLAQPALCLSRHVLDELLAREFCRVGGELRVHERWSGPQSDAGLVRASGRRIQPVVRGWRWFGLKVHARQVALQADLELHILPEGYVGLCQLNDEVNVCGLFRSRTAVPNLSQQWKNLLCGQPGTALRARLNDAELDEASFCSVAGLCPDPRLARAAQDECALGDALTMIPPFTGNGMSMAFECAEVAVEWLAGYSRGDYSWNAARSRIAAQCRQRFRSRLRTAAVLHRAMFHPVTRRGLFFLLPHFPHLAQVLCRWTR